MYRTPSLHPPGAPFPRLPATARPAVCSTALPTAITTAVAPIMHQICEAFGANRYPLPEEPNRQRAMAAEVGGRLGEMKTTLDVGETQRTRALRRVADELDMWSTLVRREKVRACVRGWVGMCASGDVLREGRRAAWLLREGAAHKDGGARAGCRAGLGMYGDGRLSEARPLAWLLLRPTCVPRQ